MALLDKIKQRVGFPFGIRGTCKKYYKKKGLVPHGNSGSEGILNDSPVQHYFIVDNLAISFLNSNQIEKIMKNTIHKCVEDYAEKHSNTSYKNLVDHGRYLEEDFPVVYLFPLLDFNRMNKRENTSFEYYKGNPTFQEGLSSPKFKIHPKGIYDITNEEAIDIDKASRYFSKYFKPDQKNINQTALAFFKDGNVDSTHNFYKSMLRLQKALGRAIPVRQRFKLPVRKLINDILLSESQFTKQFGHAFKVNLIHNHFRDIFYETCSRKIIEKIE